ncbi:MAG: lipoate--protein ligase family protein [Cyanobacteria bacterium K_DeepCast_35m_m2_023]|nr:lipoate--protein ligase family protein [Cyanobacteria bacterium K_DeepCast_35m_m2_023]
MALEPASPTAAVQLPFTTLSGSWQMALDGALLDRCEPVLRLYRWSQPTLSLGYHQHQLAPAWLQWQHQQGGALVRRPSGGGAVLHGQDLCYAVVWPSPRSTRQQAYRAICHWLQQAFAALGEPLHFGHQPAALEASCFGRSTAADLLTADGHKRIGSAQRWQRGCLLQHGSIQLHPDASSWHRLLGSPPPILRPLGLEPEELSHHLLAEARRQWNLTAQSRPLDAPLLAAAAAELERYRVPAGDSSVTSPLATMPRTTWGNASPSG